MINDLSLHFNPTWIIVPFLLITAVIIISFFMKKALDYLKIEPLEPRKLNQKEAEFMADYFHNEYNKPDYDGYVGHYSLPKEVMEIYNKKYSKVRKFGE